MSARDRLLALLDPPPTEQLGTWLDLVASGADGRGRVQEVWQSDGGAGSYDGILAVGDRVEGVIPDPLGGGALRAFYRVDERLGLMGGETVLDLACGPGTLTRRLARAVGRDGLVIAADLSEAMLMRAARSTPFECVDFARVDAADLPLRDGCVDAVSCSLCLHLVPDLGAALEEIARVLRPGAPVALAVPAHAPGVLRPITGVLARVGQVRLFRAGELSDELRDRGWTGVREWALGGVHVVDASAPA